MLTARGDRERRTDQHVARLEGRDEPFREGHRDSGVGVERQVRTVLLARSDRDGEQRAMDAGVLPEADALHTAAAVWATCHGVVSLELKDVGPPLLDWELVYATATQSMMLGLMARESRPKQTDRGRPAG